ncbi:PA14 domain-containing protein [Sphaerisporangium fuscum]|uniref:PA14 domain-containing protein n=1 Tax=Sphaerisporangium fuscum TaxID=2835868 RepID=UPI001BDBF543|nr:PA14 domain-containing protein [Sphaerisporangium fuscum]
MNVKRRSPLLLLALLLCLAGQLAAVSGASAADAARHGLRGDYYLSTAPGAFDFGELKATVADPSIEFPDLEPVFKDLTGRVDDVTVRWTGQIQPKFSEQYTFSMIGDNGFRLWVDGKLLIDNWVDVWDVEKIGTPISLEAGRKYDFKIEYFEHYGGSNLRLRWQSASQPKEIVPPQAFYLPEGFDPPGPKSAVVEPAGDTATLDFGADLAAIPAGTAEHLVLTVKGTKWPVTSVTQDTTRRSVIRLKLGFSIPAQAGASVRLSYDGNGGLAFADGTALPAFSHVLVENTSTYILATKWAKDVDPSSPLPEYPRPQLTRDRWHNLNGTWQFAAAKQDEAPPFGRDLAEKIVVPYPVESVLSGIGRHEERMWYRRTFTVPNSWKVRAGGDRLLLHLDGVDWQSTVYVNGKQVGTHKGGYGRHTVDVTGALKPFGTQELVVGVYDPTDRGHQPVGKQTLTNGVITYTSSSGIWRTVWMEPAAAAHVDALRLTPDVPGKALKATVDAAGATGLTAVLTARAGHRVVGTVSGPAGTELTLPVRDPRLWSPDDPFLYDLEVVLKKGHKKVDSVGSYFGMRSIAVGQVDDVARLLLNGKPTFHMGPLDQGFWPDGLYTAPTDEALKYDLVQTKRLGFNAVRKHVKVEPDRWYYWADRLGLLVWQDMPSMAGDPNAQERAQFEAELKEMVDQHRSVPSIVMWVPFNEGWGQYDQARIADLVKGWDPSRLVNNMSGINCCAARDGGNGDVKDFHTYPDPAVPDKPVDARVTVIGEYGGLGLPVIGHTWSGGGWGYAVESDPVALTNRYVNMGKEVQRLESCKGLSAAIYTQTTDVETELNGLMTYDRAVTKPDVQRVHDANKAVTDGTAVACG